MDKNKIRVMECGPYEVTGKLEVRQALIVPDEDNQSEQWQEGRRYETPSEVFYLCRCGHSSDKPYCDGKHASINFEGKETASHSKFAENAKRYRGKTVDMLDDKQFCAVARFCDRGENAWRMIKKSVEDPLLETFAIYEACACPSGRLVITEKDGEKIEPKLKQAIGIVEDIATNCKGPLWIKGGIEIEAADGRPYEVRNRVTLCRCGESSNMPFCDASHLECLHMKEIDR